MQVSKESNETEVMVILEALLLYFSPFQDRLLVESEPLTLSLGSPPNEGPWRFHSLFRNQMFVLTKPCEFKHMRRSANTMVDTLAKQGVNRGVPLIAYTM